MLKQFCFNGRDLSEVGESLVHSFRFGGSGFHLVAVKTFVVYYEAQDGTPQGGAVLNFL